MVRSIPHYPRALVIGASRGLGLGLVERLGERGWSVVATERRGRPSASLHALAGENQDIAIEIVDIDNEGEIRALRERLDGDLFHLVIVSAGVLSNPEDSFADQVRAVMQTNVAGAMLATEIFSDLVATGGGLGVMSSSLASIANNTAGGWEPYRSSKAALNQSLRSYAATTPGLRFALTAIDPGWVRTEVGGTDADLDVETSTSGTLDMLERRFGERGLAFLNYEGRKVAW